MSVTAATHPIIAPRTNLSYEEHNYTYPISEIKFTNREKQRDIFGDDDDTCSLSDVSLFTFETKKSKKATGRLVPLSRVIEILEEEYDCADEEPSLKDACRLWCRHVKDFIMRPADKTYSCVRYTSKHRYHLLLSLATKGFFVWCIHAVWSAAATGRPNPTDYINHPSSAGKSDAELVTEDDTNAHNENIRTSNGEVESQTSHSNHQRQPPGWRLRRPDDQRETLPVKDQNNSVPNRNENHGSADAQSHTFSSNHRNIQRQPPGWRPRRTDNHVDTPVLVLAAKEDLHKILSILGNGRPHN